MSELLGEFSRKLDAKGRLSLPADFRKELSDNLRMTLSLDGTCLYIFETEDFNKWVDSLFEARGSFNVGDSNMVRLKLKLNSRASKCEVDNAGRINISPSLRETVGFDKDVVIVGNGDHIEIWDEERWNQFLLDTDLTALCM